MSFLHALLYVDYFFNCVLLLVLLHRAWITISLYIIIQWFCLAHPKLFLNKIGNFKVARYISGCCLVLSNISVLSNVPNLWRCHATVVIQMPSLVATQINTYIAFIGIWGHRKDGNTMQLYDANPKSYPSYHMVYKILIIIIFHYCSYCIYFGSEA
jgi:hypothetical protein